MALTSVQVDASKATELGRLPVRLRRLVDARPGHMFEIPPATRELAHRLDDARNAACEVSEGEEDRH